MKRRLKFWAILNRNGHAIAFTQLRKANADIRKYDSIKPEFSPHYLVLLQQVQLHEVKR